MKWILWKCFLRRHALATGVVWLALVLLLVLLELLRNADDGEWLFAFLRTPQFALDTLPFACALGAALVICGMVFAGEMTVLRSAGLSPLSVAAYNAAAMTGFVLMAFLLGEFAIPVGAEAITTLKKQSQPAKTLWLRDNSDYIRVGKLRVDGQMEDIVIYHTDSTTLVSITFADSAKYADGWTLFNVNLKNGTEQAAHKAWALPLQPSSFEVFFKKPREMSFSDLSAAADELTAAGQDAGVLRGSLWRRWLFLLALPLLAAAAVWAMGSQRRHRTALAVLASLLLAGGYFFIAEITVQTAVITDVASLLLLPLLLLAGVVALGVVRHGA